MGRKCSRCGYIGHNSRTCSMGTTINGSGMLKLFGVQLQLDLASSSSSSSVNSMKKSFSMDCLSSSLSSSPSSSLCSSRVSMDDNVSDKASIGYLSDGLICPVQERKKGVPWTEEEHRSFLIGLERLGKGDWRGISRNFVTTRTPTQVASHAQKYFLRLANLNSKKRRWSLFDMVGSSNISRNQARTSDSWTNNLYATEFGTTQPLVRADNSPKQGIDKRRIEEIRHPYLSSANILNPFLPNMLNETLPRSSPTPSNPISLSSIAPDELELTLAAPVSLDRNKPPSPTTPVLTIPY